MSIGLAAGAGEDSAPKRDGYISPGVDRRDSVGEFSNLMAGEGVWAAVQESMSDYCWSSGENLHHAI